MLLLLLLLLLLFVLLNKKEELNEKGSKYEIMLLFVNKSTLRDGFQNIT